MSCTTFALRSKKKQVRISFVGDIMCHDSQLTSYYNSKTKSYHPEKSFQYITNRLQNSDLVLGNLETTIPKNPSDYSGYPRFGSPRSLLTALKKSGFSILSTANNHSADKGSFAIDNTISSVIEEGMTPIGTYSSDSDYDKRRNLIISKNEIKIAIYNYTYSTNGIQVPKPSRVRLIDEKTISEDISYAKTQAVDFIIIWYHFGTEYQITPDKSQLMWVNFALSNGADIVIGGHPHVVQRMEKIGEQFVAYSLGNFLSAQNRNFTDGGIILNFNLDLYTNGKKQISNIMYEPVWIDPQDYKIIPIEEMLENSKMTPNKRKKMLEYRKEFLKVMSENRL